MIFNLFKWFFIPCVIISSISSQTINFKNVSIGIGAEYHSIKKDLGKYWDNAYGWNIYGHYDINKFFGMECGMSKAEYDVKPSSIDFPEINVFIISAGLCFHLDLIKGTSLNLSGGLQSYTFEFENGISDISGNNANESEMGLYMSPGISIKIIDSLIINPFYKTQNVFSSPEFLIINNYGIRLIYHL